MTLLDSLCKLGMFRTWIERNISIYNIASYFRFSYQKMATASSNWHPSITISKNSEFSWTAFIACFANSVHVRNTIQSDIDNVPPYANNM